MSRRLVCQIDTLNEYQEAAIMLRRDKPDGDWREERANLLLGETFEFLGQHGNTLPALMPGFVTEGSQVHMLPDESRLGAADEAGDMLWFCTDIAARAGHRLNDACNSALNKHGIAAGDGTLRGIGRIATTKAPLITVPTKLSLTNRNVPAELASVTLDQNPLSVLLRMALRTVKSVSPDIFTEGPQPMIIDFERPQPADVSIGELVLALSYVSTELFGVPIEQVARFNVAKLRSRQAFGKQGQWTMAQYLAMTG